MFAILARPTLQKPKSAMVLQSKKYNEYYEFLWNVYTHAYENLERLNLNPPTQTYTDFVDAFVAFGTTHNTYFLQNEKTISNEKTLISQYKAVQSAFSTFWKSLKSDFVVKLTPTDYVVFDKSPAKTTRTKATRPAVAPRNYIMETKHLYNKIHTYNPNSQNRGAERLPLSAKSIMREVAITDTAEPPPRTDYNAIEPVNRAQHIIIWKPADTNKFGWLITKFANSRGEMGPESVPLMLRIT